MQLLVWQVYPCWGLSALSRSPWRCPWACGHARQWGSLPSRSCRMMVPAAGCWMKTGCSTTGSVGHSSQSSQCFRRSPGHPACLEDEIRKTERNQVLKSIKATNWKFSVNYFSTFCIDRIHINWLDTIFFSPVPHLTPFSYLVSLLQPQFGFDFKWKTITEIALPCLTLGKIKRVFKWWAIIKRHIMQLLTDAEIFNCWNWSHMWISVGLQKYFPTFGEAKHSKAWCVSYMRFWTWYLTGQCFTHWERGLHSGHITSYSFIQLWHCEKNILSLWL